MTDEPTDGLGNEPAAPTLDSIISGAIETHTKDDAPPAPAVEAEPVEQTDTKADATGRLHGQDGKFVAKPKDEEPAVEASQEESADTAKPAPAVAPEPAPQPLDAPARWPADKKALFGQWPRDVQEAVLERIKDQEADYTRKTQEAADLRRSAEPILNAVKPFEQYLTQIQPMVRQTPAEMIGSLLGVEYQLRTGDPNQKVQALHQIAQSYGIDLASIARGEMPPAPDPAYHQLRQSFGNLDQKISQIETWFQQEQDRQTHREIEAFRTAQDSSGRPSHPHFDRVRGVMGQLLRDDQTLTLDAAYQKAVEPINAAIADELKNREAEAEKQRLASLEKAKKAAPVRSSGTAPNGSAKARDLDSILSEAIDSRLAS